MKHDPLFDISESEGVTESERILTGLCRDSFLSLWAQANVFTDEGFKDGKGGTKELCDALVVFGDDVIVFSDKHVKFQNDRSIDVAWPRWYKRAVLESCRQLQGARSWLQRFPERVFLDATCRRKLPVPVPTASVARFHLVAVTRGSREAALAAAGNEGTGSFVLDSSVRGDSHRKRPFTIGLPDPLKPFVHVFDEVSIVLVMRELDTAVDFIDYLKAREALLGSSECSIFAPGEEEPLAAYLSNLDEAGVRRVFFRLPPDKPRPDEVVFDGSHFAALASDPGYLRKKKADRISYTWDELIERFLKLGSTRLNERFINQTTAETESGLRLLAAESRFRRRQLAEALCGMLQRAKRGDRIARVAYSGVSGETVYVFLVVSRNNREIYEDYRKYRLGLLHAYVQTARLKAPKGTTFVGIAFDNPQKDYQGGSEDLFVLMKDDWSPDELDFLEKMRSELQLWGANMECWRYRQDEYPQDKQLNSLERIKAPGN
ncbi:MAG: hypothetical protein Q8Q80_18055 [Methyloversatilis sp.]|uniref:hypothetical protein n=1 Tax=Methyloversatilis sp. TaxID=2569862 RepID=UPI00273492C9|nr:hypothetical protein [Methyloversatilis sp.]MDP3874568.1 hypothetical protein [Methyloversatilis sp.]